MKPFKQKLKPMYLMKFKKKLKSNLEKMRKQLEK